MAEAKIENHASFIWSIADLLRGPYKQGVRSREAWGNR